MRRDRVGQVVSIGNGLCRVILRSEKLARELAELPDVELRDDDAKHLGWWLIFPESIKPVIESAFQQRRTITTRRPEQMSFLDELEFPANSPDGYDPWLEADEADAENSDTTDESDGGEDSARGEDTSG